MPCVANPGFHSSPPPTHPRLAPAAIAAAVADASGAPAPPAQQAAEFVASFTAEYGANGPRFLQQGWGQATATAHSQFKFLFVYLHSPEHEVGFGRRVPGISGQGWERGQVAGASAMKQCSDGRVDWTAPSPHLKPRLAPTHPAPETPQDTYAFCRNVLCAPEVLSHVEEQFVAWGGDVRRSDAFSVRRPLLLLVCRGLIAGAERSISAASAAPQNSPSLY
jgi:hypothetical protein